MNYAVHFPDQLREHLRALRKHRGLTQAELGQLIGVSQARMGEIENNPGVVSLEQVMQVLSALRVSLVLRDEEPVEIKLPDNDRVRARELTGANLGMGPGVLVTSTDPTHAKDQSAKLGQELQQLNPDMTVRPTSKRSFVVRAKKGSW